MRSRNCARNTMTLASSATPKSPVGEVPMALICHVVILSGRVISFDADPSSLYVLSYQAMINEL